jgi:hypothetical protein
MEDTFGKSKSLKTARQKGGNPGSADIIFSPDFDMIILQCAKRVAGVISRGNSPGGFPDEGWQTPLPICMLKKYSLEVNDRLLVFASCARPLS